MAQRIKKRSGFLEHLPAAQSIELEWLARIRSVLARYGFSEVDASCVQDISHLEEKGEAADKQIWKVVGQDEIAKRALRYDLTVPLALYVARHSHELTFPARLSQIGKVWRGERPQPGRYREFIQADFDVLGMEQLPVAIDAELAEVAVEALTALDIGEVLIRISNRKILAGYLGALGVKDAAAAMRVLDKLPKAGSEAVVQMEARSLREYAERISVRPYSTFELISARALVES